MKQTILIVLIALLGVKAVESEVDKNKWGPGGRSSPFERFRNPQQEEDATDEPDDVVEEPFTFA